VRGDLLDLQFHFWNEQLKGRIGNPDGTFSSVAPVSVRPVPMAPVGSWVMRIAVRAIVIAAWIIRGPVKDRNRDRYWQTETEEDPGLSLGLSQQCDSKDHRQYDNKVFHIVTSTDVKFDFRLRHAAKGIVGTVSVGGAAGAIPMERRRYAVQGDYACWSLYSFGKPPVVGFP
jgi:hypothetical protein